MNGDRQTNIRQDADVHWEVVRQTRDSWGKHEEWAEYHGTKYVIQRTCLIHGSPPCEVFNYVIRAYKENVGVLELLYEGLASGADVDRKASSAISAAKQLIAGRCVGAVPA